MQQDIQDFYDKTKFDFSRQEQKAPDFQWPTNWIKVYFKTYPRMDKIALAKGKYQADPLTNLVRTRESCRDFEDNPISFQDFSDLLYYSMGIKNKGEHLDMTRRVYPSAGARYPIEAYILANNIGGMPFGLFHYSVKANELELLLKGDLRKESSTVFGESNYKTNPNFLVLTGVMSRTEVKYGVNAYRFALIECGHIGQNFSLIARDKNIGCCAIGGFDNDYLSKLIDLTDDEVPLYAFAFGIPKRADS